MDKYECKFPTFTFFGSFYELAEEFENEEKRKDFLVSLCTFACTGEMVSKDQDVRMAILALKPTLNISLEKHSKPKKAGPGRERKMNYQEVYGMFEHGKTNKEIAEFYKVSTRQIQKIRKEYLEQPDPLAFITADGYEDEE